MFPSWDLPAACRSKNGRVVPSDRLLRINYLLIEFYKRRSVPLFVPAETASCLVKRVRPLPSRICRRARWKIALKAFNDWSRLPPRAGWIRQ